MSLFLSGGGVECGPTNALKDVSNRLDRDHGVQQDRFVPHAGPSQPRRVLSPPTQPPAPASPTFDLSSLRAHLAPTPPQFHPPPHFHTPPLHASTPTQRPQFADAGWANGFAGDKGKGKGRADAGWNAEFEQHRWTASPQPQPQMQAYPGPAGFQHQYQYRPMAQQMPMAPWQVPQSFHPPPQMDYDSWPTNVPETFTAPHAFFQPSPNQHVAPSPVQSSTTQHPTSDTERSQASDVLARTAQSLLNGLASERSIIDDNPQLANSQFMSLIRSVADGSVVVENPQGVSLPADGAEEVVGEGARFVHRAKGDWAADFLGGGSTGGVLGTGAAGSQQFATSAIPGVHEQDAITMADGPRRAKSVHFDDRDEIRSGVPNSIEEAISMRTSVPGSGSAWEDGAMDDTDLFDDESFMAFNGRLRVDEGGDVGEAAAGSREAWSRLQGDWEQHQSASQGKIGEAIDHAHYLFQRQNPYAPGGTIVREASPTVMGVLELEGAVQQDPTDAGAWVALGLKQQENEREDAAILALSKAVQLDPNHEQAHLALAVSYTNEGEREAANTALERWIELRELRNQGLARSSAGATMATMGTMEAVGVRQALGARGRETWVEGQRRLIDRLIEMARESPEDVDADVQVALGVLFNATEEYEKAQDCFLAALSVRPDDWLLYNRLGATLANSGESANAVNYYLRALELHPSFVRALFNLGIAYTNLGQYSNAAQRVLDALRLQHADATEGYASSASTMAGGIGVGGNGMRPSVKGVTSDALWNTLRSACLHMDRPDLVLLASNKNLSAFPLFLNEA